LTWTVALCVFVGGTPAAAADAELLTSGASYFGRNQYIEYVAGDLPLVLSVPHGGDLRPDEIPDRDQAVTVGDPWSIEYTLAVADVIYQLTGHHPHVVINHLQRVKLDANRDLPYGAQDSPAAQQAWQEFHDFLDQAEAAAVEQCGRGLYLDLHSNGQPGGWIQLGYGIPATDLTLSNEELDRPGHVAESSLRSLATVSGEGLSSLLRGPGSLGGLLEARGYRAVPSDIAPWPSGITYYDGGYNVFRHGSKNGGGVDGIQIETSVDYIRPERIQTYARVLGEAILSFMEMHYGFDLSEKDGMLCPAFADVEPGQRSFGPIEALYGEGILQPCSASPRLFCPGEPLTRAAAVEMIGRAMRPTFSASDAAGVIYSDLPAGDPLNRWATLLWQAGLGTSCRQDRLALCPDQAFTRAEAARMFLLLTKGPGYLPAPPSGVFADMTVDDWMTWWAEAAANEGLIPPCAGESPLQFCPDTPLTRAEAAVLVSHVLGSQFGTDYSVGSGTPLAIEGGTAADLKTP
jgi:hypothetical protein